MTCQHGGLEQDARVLAGLQWTLVFPIADMSVVDVQEYVNRKIWNLSAKSACVLQVTMVMGRQTANVDVFVELYKKVNVEPELQSERISMWPQCL